MIDDHEEEEFAFPFVVQATLINQLTLPSVSFCQLPPFFFHVNGSFGKNGGQHHLPFGRGIQNAKNTKPSGAAILEKQPLALGTPPF